MGREKDKSEHQWKAKITFVPFESEAQRNEAYRIWVKMFLKGRMKDKYEIERKSAEHLGIKR
jgi:hypothetical protein